MSIIVKMMPKEGFNDDLVDKENGDIILFMKGADEVVMRALDLEKAGEIEET